MMAPPTPAYLQREHSSELQGYTAGQLTPGARGGASTIDETQHHGGRWRCHIFEGVQIPPSVDVTVSGTFFRGQITLRHCPFKHALWLSHST